MSNTVVSIFRDASEAENARRHLVERGFTDNNINIKTASYKSDDTAQGSDVGTIDVLERITAFFRDLFGADDEEVTSYAHAGHKGTIVTVHTDTSEDAVIVAGILDAYGAEHATETAGSYFPEHENQSENHHFMDMPSHSTQGADRKNDPRTSNLKSRIVKRSLENNNREQSRLDFPI